MAQKPIRQTGTIADKFFASPFTVLNARDGWWQARKAAWRRLGLDSGAGRDGLLLYSPGSLPPAAYQLRSAAEARLGRKVSWPELQKLHPGAINLTGTSLFDPVLCELMYRWFSPAGDLVLDPFAGGVVRGAIAAKLGRSYWGLDLSARQIAANKAQWRRLAVPGDAVPIWKRGDAGKLARLCPADLAADLILTCPPYGDLERYSDDRADLSTMRYPQFMAAFEQILKAAADRLKPGRFAVVVVGDFRDGKGILRGFPSDTIAAAAAAGLQLYNDAVLVTQAGSLPIRVGKIFGPTRKLGRCHQHVLVFVKGDPRRAMEACGPVDVGEIAGLTDSAE